MRAPNVLPGSGLKTIEENNSRAETALHVSDMFKDTHTVHQARKPGFGAVLKRSEEKRPKPRTFILHLSLNNCHFLQINAIFLTFDQIMLVFFCHFRVQELQKTFSARLD